jgi:hypothetical protein
MILLLRGRWAVYDGYGEVVASGYWRRAPAQTMARTLSAAARSHGRDGGYYAEKR